jgi:hypothetical protein
MSQHTTSQAQPTTYLLERLTVSICNTETHIKVVMSFYTYQPTRSSSGETSLHCQLCKIVNKVAALAETEGMPSGLKIVSKMDTILYNLTWIAVVDTPNNNDKDDNEIQDDEMHSDNIAGLAPTGRQQDNTHNQINNEIEIVDGHQDQTHDNKEIKIVFEPDEEATNEEILEKEDEPDQPEFDRLIRTRSG